MNTQYPAGTGFDPRYQRPRGVNVGGVGNIYAPQPEPEEEGINPLAILGGLAAAGATAVGGYYGGKRLGMWGKGKQSTNAATVARPVNQDVSPDQVSATRRPLEQAEFNQREAIQGLLDRQELARQSGDAGPPRIAPSFGRIGATGNLYADLNSMIGSPEAAKVREDLLNDVRFYGRTEENRGKGGTLGVHMQVGSPNIKWRKDALALGNRNRELGLSPFSKGDDSAATLRAYAEGIQEQILAEAGGITEVVNTQNASLTDVEAAPKIAQQEIVDAVAPGPTTLTGAQKFEEQQVRAQNFRKQFIADQKRVGPIYDPEQVVIEGMNPQEIAALRGQDPRAVKPITPVSTDKYEYPAVVQAITLRSANPDGITVGNPINIKGRDFNVVETDKELGLAFIQDPDSKQPLAVRMIGLKDAEPEPLDVDVSRFFVDKTAEDIVNQNAQEAARQRRGKSFTARVAETLGIPLEEARQSVGVGRKLNAQRRQQKQVFSAEELLSDPSKVDAMLAPRIDVSPEEEAQYRSTVGQYFDTQRAKRRQAEIDYNAFKEEKLPVLPYPIDKLGPVGLDKTVTLAKGLPEPIDLRIVSIDPDTNTFLARNAKTGLARKFEALLPGEQSSGGVLRNAAARELAAQQDSINIFRNIEEKNQVELPTPTLDGYPKAVLDPLTITVHSQQENGPVKVLHPFAALNAGLSGGFDISGMDLLDLQQIAKRTAGNPSLLESLSSDEKHVLARATKAVAAVSADAAQDSITTTLLTGELALPTTKGLSWDKSDPNKTKIFGYSPRSRVAATGRRNSATPAISSYSQFVRNPLTGELGRPKDFGISNNPSDYGGIGQDIARFTVGFEQRQPNLEMQSSLGSSNRVASPEEEIAHAIGMQFEGSNSRGSKSNPQPYKPTSFLDLLQRSRAGQSTLDLEDGYYRYDGVIGTDRGYKPIPLVDESATGILGTLGTEVRLDRNNKPYIRSSSRITDQTAQNAALAREYEVNSKGRVVERSRGSDGSLMSYAPGGLTDGTKKSPIGIERKGKVRLDGNESSIARELENALISNDIDLTPEQLDFKQRVLALPQGERADLLATTVALVRSGNRAKVAANKIGMDADRRVQSARTDGVSLRGFLPKSGSMTDDDINELPNNLRRTILDEIPNIQGLVAAGKISPEDGQTQIGKTALGRAIGNILEGTGLSKSQIEEVQSRIGQESPLVELMGSNGGRTEGRKKQAAIQEVDAGLTLELAPRSTAGQGIGRNYDSLPKHRSAAKMDADKDADYQRQAERLYKVRNNAADTIGDALSEKADAITEAETDILTRNRNNTAGGSMLDRLVRIIQSTPDDEALPDEFTQVQPLYATQENAQGEIVQVPKLDKNGRQIRRRLASDDIRAALDRLNESEASLAGLEIDPAALIPAGVDKRGNPVFTRKQGDIPNYSRPSINDWTSNAETKTVRNAYLLSDSPGIVIPGREGDINLGMTYSDLEDDVQLRRVVDRSAPAPEKGRRSKTKQVGGWPTSWSPQAARDYTEDVQIKNKYSEEARRDPKGIFAETERLNTEIDQRNAQRIANPTGTREYDELEENISPMQLQAQIRENPQAFNSTLIKDAARELPDNYEWQGRGMDQNPLLAATTLEVLDDMGLGRPKEIQDYVDVMKLEGTQYSGNSAPKLLGSMMYQTLIGQQGRGTSRAKINRPDKPEDPNNPLSSSYQSTKDEMGRFARASAPNEYLQRELGITRGTKNDPIDPNMSKEEAIERALNMGRITASTAEKMRGDDRITSEILQEVNWEIRPGRTVDPSYRIPEQIAEAVRRGLISAEDAVVLKESLLREDQLVRPRYNPMVLRTKAEQDTPSRINIPRPVRGVKAKASGATDGNIYANETGTVTAADVANLNAVLRGGTIPKPKSSKATARPGIPSYGEQVRQVPVYSSESGEVPSAEFMRLDNVNTDMMDPSKANASRIAPSDRAQMARERRVISKVRNRADTIKSQYLDNVIDFIEQGEKPILNVERDGTVLGMGSSELLSLTGMTPQQFVTDINNEVGSLVNYKLQRDRRASQQVPGQQLTGQAARLIDQQLGDYHDGRAKNYIDQIVYGLTDKAPVDGPTRPRVRSSQPPLAADPHFNTLFDDNQLNRLSWYQLQDMVEKKEISQAQADFITQQRTRARVHGIQTPYSSNQARSQAPNNSTDRIQRAVNSGKITQEAATRLMAEREVAQGKVEELNRQSSSTEALNSLMQRFVPANQGVVMRNLNG
jgi:hypothetical protein